MGTACTSATRMRRISQTGTAETPPSSSLNGKGAPLDVPGSLQALLLIPLPKHEGAQKVLAVQDAAPRHLNIVQTVGGDQVVPRRSKTTAQRSTPRGWAGSCSLCTPVPVAGRSRSWHMPQAAFLHRRSICVSGKCTCLLKPGSKERQQNRSRALFVSYRFSLFFFFSHLANPLGFVLNGAEMSMPLLFSNNN